MDWRIVAAAFAALVVLGGGTLLAAQVQTDLDEGVQQRIRDSGLERPTDAAPLKLNEFKLPKDVPLEIPPGTEISPDLSKMTLPKDLDLQIPDDLDLSNLDFELPEDFDLQLPAGSEFAPPGLKLPEGATIKLPDGKEFKLPPGSDLDLPPELVDRLLSQGLPAGKLQAPRDLNIRGLPPELHANLDPPQFTGGGTLHLPGGTTIALPEGQQFPFPAGLLAYAARSLLPAGSTFDIPFDETSSGGGFPVPQPRSPSQLVREDPSAPARTGVATEITSMPARVRKGEPVTVSGYVRDASTGRAIAGAPVDIFMNESKRTPGVLVGQGVSDASGTFTIRLDLPTDKPAREYQLVNHAAAFVDPSGRPYADGWGDPPFATTASTVLTLELPARDGFGTATTLGGTLLDNTGAPVPSATITLTSDSVVIGRPVTTSAGRYSLQYTFPAGVHVVEARFAGTSFYDPATAPRANITIEDYAIEIAPILRAKPGEALLLTGRVLGKGAVAPERALTIDGLFGAPTIRLVSDSAGRFSYSFATPTTTAPGTYTVTYHLPDHRVTKTQQIEINQTARLAMTLPSLWDVELPLTTTVTLRSALDQPITGQTLRVTMEGPGGTRDFTGITGSAGDVQVTLQPLRATPGAYTVSARILNNPHLEAPSLSQTLNLGAFEVAWDVPEVVVRGEQASVSATVSFSGRPLSNAPVTLDVFGPRQVTTDALGRVSWSETVPASATLGDVPLSVQAVDHPLRSDATRVVAVPKLALDAPEVFELGVPVQASLRLTDDQGAPLRDAAVTITTVSNDAIERTVVRTDADGRWNGALNVTTTGGNVTMSARYDATGTYLGADEMQSMAAQMPTLVGGGSFPWLIPLVGLALAGGAGATWYVVRKRRAGRPRKAEVAAAVTLAHPSEVDLRFGIPEGEPAVWGIGDPLALAVRNVGAAGDFELQWPGGATSVHLAQGADSATTLEFPQEGEVTLTARRQGGEFDPAAASVRIVDYRKETAREFDLFLDKARGIDTSLTRQSTPREIVWTLEPRLGSGAHAWLDELAFVMEITNYSHYAVSREHYLRFVKAARALDPFFAPAPEPAPATPGG